VKTRKKGKNLNTLEKYNVYRTSKDTLEWNTNWHNTIFETLYEINTG
jgi:hypothetical protein